MSDALLIGILFLLFITLIFLTSAFLLFVANDAESIIYTKQVEFGHEFDREYDREG